MKLADGTGHVAGMVPNRPRWAHLALLASLCASPLTAACIDPTVVGGGDDGAGGSSSTEGAGGGTGGSAVDCSQVTTAWLTTRGLTRTEYANTIRDLLAIDDDVTADFPEDERWWPGGFRRGPLVTSPPPAHYLAAASSIAALAVADMPALLGCDPQTSGEDACAQQLIDGLGPRALRRPLQGAEATDLFAAYTAAKGGGTYQDGIRAIVAALLSAPAFIYRLEPSITGANPGDVAPVPAYELAARLSYFLWKSMPDAELFGAAASGELATAGGVEAQAQRMLADPRAASSVRTFHMEWLNVERGDYPSEKDPEVFPEFSDELMATMKLEMGRFAEHVVLEGDGKLATLLGSTAGFVDDDLAALYGLPAVGSDDLVQVDLPPERTGILTRAAFLTVNAKSNSTSPTHRGISVRRALLCQELPPPPPDVVPIIPPPDDEPMTLRERLELATADPTCNSCHHVVDPIGFGFERFDGIGRLQNSDNGLPIDDSGEVVDLASAQFVGAAELSQILASDAKIGNCVTSRWFQFGLGVDDPASEACLQQGFAASGNDVRALMVSIALSSAFRFRPALAP